MIPPLANNAFPSGSKEAVVQPAARATPAAPSTAPQSTAAKQNQPSENRTHGQALKDLAQQANKDIQSRSTSIQFSVDGDTGASVVKVVDKETNEVITQLPQKEMLDVAKALKKSQKAVFLNKET